MRVLAEIRWCETHEQNILSADDPAFCAWGETIWESALCVVVDAQVTERCADCNGTGEIRHRLREEMTADAH